jgi:hypothetical protein
MDHHIKNYFDTHRVAGTLPPELENTDITHLYKDSEEMEKWRSWKLTNLKYTTEEGHTLSGALDECAVVGDELCPLDYKTKGSPLTYNPARYYATQLDCYGLMLQSAGHKIGRYGYLLYYWPTGVKKNGAVKFEVRLYKNELNVEKAKLIVQSAIRTLNGPCPPSTDCEYCDFYTKRVKNDFKKKDIED